MVNIEILTQKGEKVKASSDALSAFGEVHLTLTLHKRRVRRLLLLMPRLSLRKLPENTNPKTQIGAKRPLIFHFQFFIFNLNTNSSCVI
jgi:hypothetical protein